MTEKEILLSNQMKTLLGCLEEHIIASEGFANLHEAIVFYEASKIVDRKTEPYVDALLEASGYKESYGPEPFEK